MSLTQRPDALTVGQVNEYVRMLLENNAVMRDVWVMGEITGAKLYASGHLYFSLKDPDSVLSAVLFRGQMARLNFRPENGMKVLVHGKLSVYTPRGSYQLIADRVVPDGAGALAAAFEQLKARLSSEGLFDAARKKKLPPFPRRIGVVTSPSGAAIHDIIRVSRKRYPAAGILLFPSLVQGDGAAASLCGGVRYFNSVRDDPEQSVDLIILGRGGGSAEDLQAFNDEQLARTVAASDLPVVSAVGHEVDFSICDFVADLRAATPSAAAELSLPDREDLLRRTESLMIRMTSAEESRLNALEARLDRVRRSKALTSPEEIYRIQEEHLHLLSRRLLLSAERLVTGSRQRLGRMAGQIEALSPLGVLGRGYALVQNDEGHVVPSASDLSVGDAVSLRFRDGSVSARITEIPQEDSHPDTR